jgi:hypothetical protein
MDLEFYKKMYPEYFLGKSDDYILDFYNKYGKDQYHIINEEEYQERREKTRTKPGKKDKFYKKVVNIQFYSDLPSLGPPAPRGRFYTKNINKFHNEVSSVIDLRHFKSFDEYINMLKLNKKEKKTLYYYRRAIRNGYYFKKFWDHNFLPDIVEIQCSKKVRQGEMRGHYLKPVPSNYKNRPILNNNDIKIKNNLKYTLKVGIFKKIEGYKQGHIVTNEKLVAFITILRDGDYIQYSWIIGHGDYLKDGIMIFLHLKILKEIVFNKNCEYGKDVKYIFYHSHYSGNESLTKWKEKLFFSPTILVNN